MLFRYFKGEPNAYVIRYQQGDIVQQGTGISFFYMPMNTSVASIPVGTQDVPFIFNETTANFQDISIQGQLTFRLADPMKVAKILDFTIDHRTKRHRSGDPERLKQRIINAVQSYTRVGVNQLQLESALMRVRDLAKDVMRDVRQEHALNELGVVVESLYFVAILPTPEMKKALEAEYREGLQRKADQAIYGRRAAAVEEERKIREEELNTEVGLEERRRELVDLQARNNLALAEVEGKTFAMKLEPYNALAPQALVGMALKEWAANAGKIGNLHITPNLLTELVEWVGGEKNEKPS